MKPSDITLSILDKISEIHTETDRKAAELEKMHGPRLHCRRGCSSCCVDGITVFEVEAEPIRRHYGDLLEEGTPGPDGGCAFLDADGACRIYLHRPYVCRTQGLPLRWIEESETEGEWLEYRDICPLNAEGDPVEELPEEACWTLGPVEGRLAALQKAFGGGKPRRIALRNLFRK